MKPIAYRLRQRIDIQALTVTRDSDGRTSEDWASIFDSEQAGELPADITAMSGNEFVAAQAVQGKVDSRILIRKMPGLMPSMRAVHQTDDGEDIYNIRAVLPDPKMRQYITLLCERGVNNG